LINKNWTVTPNTKQYDDGSKDGLMMLHSDLALLQTPEMLKLVKHFAENENDWFVAFAAAFQKLQELGVANTLLPPLDW